MKAQVFYWENVFTRVDATFYVYLLLTLFSFQFICQSAWAHTVNTHSLTIEDRDEPNASSSFVLQGHGLACPTLVSIEVTPEGFVNVDPAGPISVTSTQLFVVTPTSATGTGTITVRWAHGDIVPDPLNPCYQAMDQGHAPSGTEIITITVIDPVIAFNTTQANMRQAAQSGDPVSTGTGELFFTTLPDLIYTYAPFRMPLQRYYASQLLRSGIAGRMGNNWLHNYEWLLAGEGNALTIIDHQGRETSFLRESAAAPWEPQDGLDLPMQVTQNTDTGFWYVLDPGSDWVYVFSTPDGLAEVKLTGIVDGHGNEQHLSYDGNGLLVRVEDLFGRFFDFTYDSSEPDIALKHLVGVTDGIRSISFSYSEQNLTGFTDALGQTTQYQYDSGSNGSGLLTRRILPGGSAPWAQTYDDKGRVATQIDGNGNVTTFDYDETESITSVTRPDEVSEIHTYDELDALISSVNARGLTTDIVNTDTSARSSVTAPDGGQFSSTYDAISGKVSSETFANGQAVAYQYGSRTDTYALVHRDLTQRTFPDGTFDSWTYDQLGNRASHTNQSGHGVTWQYDGSGRVTSESNRLGGVTIHTYDSVGNRETTTDPQGNLTRFTYDVFDRLTRVEHPDGEFRLRSYDALNRITEQTLESGGATAFTYDANNNLTSRTDPSGDEVSHTFDSNGNPLTTSRAGGTLSYQYDNLGRLVSLVPDGGARVDLAYLNTDEVSSMSNALGNETGFSYDPVGRLTAVTSPSGSGPHYTYDLHGQITSATDAEDNHTTYSYDALGRLTLSADPSGKARSNTFFANGPVRSIEYSGGARSELERNAMDFITRITGPNNEFWSFSYDTSGRITSNTDPVGNTTAYSYDSRNRVRQIAFPGGGTEQVSYDAAGNVSRRHYNDGTILSYTHDINGRLISSNDITVEYDSAGRVVNSNGVTMTIDGSSHRISSMTIAPGKMVTYQYDEASQLIGVTDWTGRELGLTRDIRGNVVQIDRANNISSSYTFDSMGRRTHISHGDMLSYGIERNADGQIQSVDRTQGLVPALFTNGPIITYSYDSAYRITRFNYDSRGRRLIDDANVYSYDDTSCLQHRTLAAGNTEIDYECNGFGHMISRTKNGSTREYVWNHALDLPAINIIRQDDADRQYFIYTPSGRLLYSVDAGNDTAFYYHFDERGNTAALTDDSGSIVAQYAYDPAGRITRQQNAGIDNHLTFGAKYGIIEDNGLFHMRRRVYDPQTGQFLTPDPVPGRIEPVGINPYLYAVGDPQNWVDPMGLTPTAEEVADGTLDAARGGTQAAGMRGAQLSDQAADALKTANKLMGEVELFGPLGHAGANRAWRAFEDFEKADDLSRHLDDAAKTPNRLGQIGRGLQVLDIALTMNKLRNELNTNLADYDAATRGSIASYAGRVEAVFDIYHKKNKTLTWLEAQLRIQLGIMQLEMLNASFLYDVNTVLDIWVAYANGLGSFIPGFTGLDPDAGNNVGFLFF